METMREIWICDCGRMKTFEFDPTKNLLCFKCGSALHPSGQMPLQAFGSVSVAVDVSVEDKVRILKFLIDNKGVFFRASEIASRLNLKREKTQINVRKAVLLLIQEDQPIVSNPKGFAFVSSTQQVQDYIGSLEARKRGLDLRINKLYQILESMRQGGA